MGSGVCGLNAIGARKDLEKPLWRLASQERLDDRMQQIMLGDDSRV
jgi:hypothetical protein